MNRGKYIFIFFISTLVYVLLSVTFGQNSIYSINQLDDQKKIISKRTSDIQNINSELKLELTALQNDRAVIAAYARKLDYVSDGEKIVKITGLKPAQTTLYDTGTVLRHVNPSYISEKYCKIISIIMGLLTFFILFLYDLNNGNISFTKTKKNVMVGIPIYDLPQV